MGCGGGEEAGRMAKGQKPSSKSIKPKARAKAAAHKTAAVRKKAAPKTKTPAKAARPSKPVGARNRVVIERPKTPPAHKPEPAPRLLRENKATAAALVLLEKGIKLIYQKEFKKARAEFKSLLQDYPGEPEILVRARTYIQICEREEHAHKKPLVGNDQLYNMGVIEHNRGNYEKAISYFLHSLEKNPGADHIYYTLAASFALKGDSAESLKNLPRAIEMNEENRA